VLWWNVARASGLMAWALLSASVLAGLLMGTRLTRRSTRRFTQGYHQFVGALAVTFTTIHVVSVFSAVQLQVGVVQLLFPFTKPDDPAAQGCGVIAFYLLTAVVLTSWVQKVMPWRWWRRVHLLSLPLWGLATVHTVLAGTDIADPAMYWEVVAVTAVVVCLMVVRLATARRAGAGTAPDAGLPAAGKATVAGGRPRLSWSVVSPAMDTPVSTGMQLIISQTTWEAENVLSLRLGFADGTALPSWEPGAHIELALPSGRRRQYSLCGDPQDTRTYRIAVLRVPIGRGGSVELHTIARVGQQMTVHVPRNHFPMVVSPAYLFIAGGIGITPMMAMAAQVASADCEWKLVYSGRRRASMAFVNEVRALGANRVDVLPGDERERPDLPAIINAAPPGAAVYCCGPDRMMQAVREQVLIRGDLSLHSERFTCTVTGGAAFQVELLRSRHIIDVPTNRTILQAVHDVVPAISAGCEQGVCGACRTTILAGEPDHRDELLSNAERAAGAMLICVSRARTERLTLDL
jgi:ferredoxin-NADP reductase/DMSO/TMAO reductase YedYZ heme-binding membrane subunit